ncbi:Uncharacterised protein [uncultured archaeon]|nr:Uncharacterised protein [uncultured archaeon]
MMDYKPLLKFSREAIKAELENRELKISEEIRKKYAIKKASFVTLTKNEKLRGCIGSLYPRRELYKDVFENALHAAFNDPRFSSLKSEELPKIKIEIFVLSIPIKINFKNEKELLEKIDIKMGIILKKNSHSATFLPNVWEKIPNKVKFLEQLSLKAKLQKNDWKRADIYFYRTESVKE